MTGAQLKAWRTANLWTQERACSITGVPYGSWIRCETDAWAAKSVPAAVALAVQVVSLGYEPVTVAGRFEHRIFQQAEGAPM